MGDPEAEVVVPRIENDLVALLQTMAQQQLDKVRLQIDRRCATTIVAASGGYPNDYQKGLEITGLDEQPKDRILFHAGTVEDNGKILTNGGRVVCATALAERMEEAIVKSKELIEAVQFEGKYFRKDIGFEFLNTQDAVNQPLRN
jgi:phosphoribosylamine--glycine ligase